MKAKLFLKKNASAMLAVVSCIGVVATGVLSARAAPKANKMLDDAKSKKGADLTPVEKVETVALTYLPAVLTGGATILCVLSAQIINQHHQASLASAYALADQSYKEYRKKLKELYGEETDQKIIEAIAVERAEKTYISASYLCGDCDLSIDDSTGKEIWFYEEYSKRFFKATIERVQSAEYHLNRNYILRGDACLNEFYSFLGLKPIDDGNDMIWIPTDEGEYWIEFNHLKSKTKDGTEFYIIEMPFAPRLGYELEDY